MYVGSAINFDKRWKAHRRRLNARTHPNIYLQSAWSKYGEAAFEFSEIEFVDREDLISKEQYYFDLLKPEYNICPTAGNSLGRKHTRETKQKISGALIGTIRLAETKQKISSSRMGITFSEETKQKMRKPKSEEHIKHNSESHKGKIPWNKGKIGILSDEIRLKISSSMMGNKNASKTR